MLDNGMIKVDLKEKEIRIELISGPHGR